MVSLLHLSLLPPTPRLGYHYFITIKANKAGEHEWGNTSASRQGD